MNKHQRTVQAPCISSALRIDGNIDDWQTAEDAVKSELHLDTFERELEAALNHFLKAEIALRNLDVIATDTISDMMVVDLMRDLVTCRVNMIADLRMFYTRSQSIKRRTIQTDETTYLNKHGTARRGDPIEGVPARRQYIDEGDEDYYGGPPPF